MELKNIGLVLVLFFGLDASSQTHTEENLYSLPVPCLARNGGPTLAGSNLWRATS